MAARCNGKTRKDIIAIPDNQTAPELERRFADANPRHCTDFIVRRFRKPCRTETGEWDCVFQLPVLVSRYGTVEHEHGLPERSMFDLRFVRAMLLHDRYRSKTMLRMDVLDPHPAHPVTIATIRDVDWVLSYEDVLEANLIVDEDSTEPRMPWLFAVIERKSGLVYPMAVGTRMELESAEDAGGWTVSIAVHWMEDPREPAQDFYPEYFDEPSTVSDAKVRARIRRDSALLRKRLALRQSDGYRQVRESVNRLRSEYEGREA